MTSSRVLLQLSKTIQDNTAQVDQYIGANKLPEPSFDASYPPILELSREADAARLAALEALDELRAHLLGPIGLVMHHVDEMSQFVSLHGMAEFNIPAALPSDGTTITISDLASRTGMHIDDTKTIVRHASSRHLLHHLPGDEVAHCSASKAMLLLPGVAGVMSTASALSKSEHHVVDAMAKWPGSQDLHQTAYSLAHNTELSFFEHLASEPERAKQFADSMTFLTSNPALSSSFVFAYDWNPHATGTIVDIGGSHGNIAFPQAERFHEMKIVVQDRPEIIATAPLHQHANVTFQAHDFFTTQPVHGADVYFLRFILHDWPTSYCLRILRALIPALKRGARVLIMDGIVPEPGVLGKLDERRIMGYDVLMKTLFNSKERSEGEWRDLISEADEEGRFRVVQVLQPRGSQLGFVVVEWTG